MARAERWLRLSFLGPLLLLAGLVLVFDRVVDLTPRVSSSFFFARDDPALRETLWIAQRFPGSDEMLVLAMRSPDIRTEAYRKNVEALTEAILQVPAVLSVRSLTAGPGGLEEVLESPLWRRLLIGSGENATLALVFHEAESGPRVVPKIEAIARQLARPDFDIRISGAPFVVEMIRRYLERDLRTFTMTSFAVFALLMLAAFRSLWVLAGMVGASLGAMLLTLIVQVLLGGSIGILTANVATIVAVITQSHVVFMTANLRSARSGGSEAAPALLVAALRRTLPASLWCALTTVLGFASLLFVQAQPLQDLGLSGSVGTAAALLCAYLLFPPFLYGHARGLARRAAPAPQVTSREGGIASRRLTTTAVVGGLVLAALGVGLYRLDTDPSLLDYFQPGEPLREGLDYVDQTLGSSPFDLVVSDAGGGVFRGREILEREWALHQKFEDHGSVGGALSLPILIGEGQRTPIIGRLLPVDWIVSFLNKDFLGRVGEGFITPDRRYARFMMTMRETERTKPRLEVVNELRKMARDTGFEVSAVGGLYYLQAHLGTLVRSSLLSGITALLVLFCFVALAASRSLRTSLGMVTAIALVPLATLGGLGLLRIPVDVISSPASNVCIGMAADAMIHLVLAVRRQAAGARLTWVHWVAARREQATPILIATGLVVAGFAIFTLSAFPPTRRFGLAVVFGTLVAAFGALILLPYLAGPRTSNSE